jgi:fumarate reductase subunit C
MKVNFFYLEKGGLTTMSNRIRIILSFITVMAIIFHGRLFFQCIMPLAYIQIVTTLSALILLIWRSYLWIDYGNARKWHFDRAAMRDNFGFQEQIYIKSVGWAVFVTTLVLMSLALLSKTWQDFIWFTHIPLTSLVIELYIPYKHLMPFEEWYAIDTAQRESAAAATPPSSSNQYQSDPVRYHQQQEFNKQAPTTIERRTSSRFGKMFSK